jgi:ketosteroid isomerase-like protein
VTIFGGWGAYERGWDQVSARLDWAAARFVDGQHDQEVLTMDCGGEVGWTVCLERGEVRVIGQGVTAPIVLRVTHVYRREDAQWWVVHRHADPATGKTAPTAVLSNPTS